jgi:integral membrane sensor domain MASE1
VTSLVLIGGYGPALAGVLTLNLKSDEKVDLSLKRLVTFIVATATVFGVMALRCGVGNVPNYDMLADDLTLSVPIVAAALVASLVGGWAISSAVSCNDEVRARMGSLLPF